MAVRILEYGKYNYVVCTDCGEKFAFDSSDIVEHKVRCPMCGTDIAVTEREVKTKDSV